MFLKVEQLEMQGFCLTVVMCACIIKDLLRPEMDNNFTNVADAEVESVCDHNTKLVSHICIHVDSCEYNVWDVYASDAFILTFCLITAVLLGLFMHSC